MTHHLYLAKIFNLKLHHLEHLWKLDFQILIHVREKMKKISNAKNKESLMNSNCLNFLLPNQARVLFLNKKQENKLKEVHLHLCNKQHFRKQDYKLLSYPVLGNMCKSIYLNVLTLVDQAKMGIRKITHGSKF